MSNTGITQQEKPTTISGMMRVYKKQIAMALPSHMTPDRMVRIVITEVRKNPALMRCDPASMFGAVIQCSQLGLEPGGVLGHAYFVPFKNKKKGITEVQLIVGYRGMIDMARRSGQIISISAHCWYDNDQFNYSYGLNQTLEHVPADGEPGKIKGAYAVARLHGGGCPFDVMSIGALNKIKALSKTSGYGPWIDHFDEMARKTVVRRLFKYLPVSIEMQTAVGLGDKEEAGMNQHNADILDGDYDVDFIQDGKEGSVLGSPQSPDKPKINNGVAIDWSLFEREKTRIEIKMTNGRIVLGIYIGINGDEIALRGTDGMEMLKIGNIASVIETSNPAV